MNARLSIIIPALNEAACLQHLLKECERARADGHEVILADGGSTDATATLATLSVDLIVDSKAGRAVQMNAAAASASGDLFWFVHADTRLSLANIELMYQLLSRTGPVWGWFDIKQSGSTWIFRVIETMMNWRARVTRVATGDMGIFVDRDLFFKVGGYDVIPIMEDIALSKRLRKKLKPSIQGKPLIVSSRRWQKYGIAKTIFLMWGLRLFYFLRVSPKRLAKWYR